MEEEKTKMKLIKLKFLKIEMGSFVEILRLGMEGF